MKRGAPRPPLRPLRHLGRGGLTGLCLWLAAAGSSPACPGPVPDPREAVSSSVVSADGITVWYAHPTDRYPHGVLGDDLEPTTLGVLDARRSAPCGSEVTLAPPLVFEDVAPRLWDVTGNGVPEIVTVRSHEGRGAQLAIYRLLPDGGLTLLATTPHIGTRFRWLAPVGAADFDGDGHVEVAFVDRPHLARILQVWRWTGAELRQVARLNGLTNHRIGETAITGGVRDCGAGPEMVLADANWSRIMAVRLDQARISASPVAPFRGPDSVAAVLDCR